ncbi:MAG: type II toxin-antitoxin system RelE/ParE family toxin [Rubellimicrobium sp.]|nr:type II toxin-antitoxin system RelE/ParE family toxin [Rubellimicrobium sp.]
MDIDGKNLVALKPCLWVAGSRDDMRAFPDRVKRDMGAALMYAQAGGRSGSARQLKGLGPGVVEIVENHDGDTYRCVYLLRLKGVIYVLHAFQKKSKTGIRTPQKDVDLIRSRIRLAEEDHRTRERK